jgi:hypothetical protein
MTPKKLHLINAAAVRRAAINLAEINRHKKFDRVSHQFLVDCHVHLESYIRSRVHSAPSLGQTL